MNKNAKEKQLLEEAYSQVLGEDWNKGTSKAPKGASFDSEKNYKPSGVDANSDGPAGRYRRTRPPGSGSTQTHGEAGISSDEEVKVGSMVTTNYGEVVHIDEIDTDSDMKGRPVYMGTDQDGGEHILYPDQIHAVSDEEHPEEDELEALIAYSEDAEDVDVDENKDEDKHVTDEAEAFKEVEEDTPE